jgi:hypothetical protein
LHSSQFAEVASISRNLETAFDQSAPRLASLVVTTDLKLAQFLDDRLVRTCRNGAISQWRAIGQQLRFSPES